MCVAELDPAGGKRRERESDYAEQGGEILLADVKG